MVLRSEPTCSENSKTGSKSNVILTLEALGTEVKTGVLHLHIVVEEAFSDESLTAITLHTDVGTGRPGLSLNEEVSFLQPKVSLSLSLTTSGHIPIHCPYTTGAAADP